MPVIAIFNMISLACELIALVFAFPAFAMRPLPAEFGEKNPLITFTGWVVLGAGCRRRADVLGVFAPRGRTWRFQALALLVGAVGMMAIWLVGLVLAVDGFFLTY